jgi:hypothetical protein
MRERFRSGLIRRRRKKSPGERRGGQQKVSGARGGQVVNRWKVEGWMRSTKRERKRDSSNPLVFFFLLENNPRAFKSPSKK